jgi:hypothetical protein
LKHRLLKTTEKLKPYTDKRSLFGFAPLSKGGIFTNCPS